MQEQIVIVDGFAIRNTLDLEFDILMRRHTRIPYYLRTWYIPEGELWVDAPYEDELPFLLKVHEYFFGNEDELVSRSYQESRAQAKEVFCEKGPVPKLESRRETDDKGLSIVYVDGALVRRFLDPEFFVGGHEFVYDYVPKGEIWIDIKVLKEEQSFVLLHERIEHEHMQAGENYDIAHDIAIAYEKQARRKAGIAHYPGHYPGDVNYPWRDLTNDAIIQRYVKRRLTGEERTRLGL